MAKVIITETFYPKTRAQWRKWLEKNHDKKSEIWLMRYKKATGKPTVAYQDSVDEALCFGWIDGFEKSVDEERYATRFTPRRAKSGWSEINVGRYKMLVKEGLMTKAGEAAFKDKGKVAQSSKMKAGGREWHEKNKLGRGATVAERVSWHKAHQKYCGCREVPKSLKRYS